MQITDFDIQALSGYLKKIKLIIWDLDDTLWTGTLSEGEIYFPEKNQQLIKDLSKRGIVNAICSKNEQSYVDQVLSKYEIASFFVFNSIDWNPKGPRVQRIIKNMALRPENILFIDDNERNLGEVEFYNSDIMTALPGIIPALIANCQTIGKDDHALSRLEQYKLLERKQSIQNQYSDEAEFLTESKIEVYFGKDCIENIDRIYELLLRSNQLNYTKNRVSRDELLQSLSNKNNQCRYICAKDKFGFYGLIGFYVLDTKLHKLTHFLFSCRTMGMHIEQYIYQQLRYPALDVVEPVTVALSEQSSIDYIRISKKPLNDDETPSTGDVLIKGPCDMDAIAFYLGRKSLTTEFRYVNAHGNLISNGCHSAVLHACVSNSTLPQTPFVDNDVYQTSMYSGQYKLIILSTVVEAMLGEYRNKADGSIAVFGEWAYDATKQENIKSYIDQTAFNGFTSLTPDDYMELAQNFEYVGRVSPQELGHRYQQILDGIPSKTQVCLILGPQIKPKAEVCKSLIGADKYYTALNSELKNVLSTYKNVRFLNISDYISDETSFDDSITHFNRDVYYKMSIGLMEMYPDLLSVTSKNVFWGDLNQYKHKVKKAVKNLLFGK